MKYKLVKLQLKGIREKRVRLPVEYTPLSQLERADIRELYIKRQKGKCWYCKNPLDGLPTKKVLRQTKDFHPKFFIYGTHLHHDHDTDLTVGAVHSHCNMVLWVYEGE